MSEFTNGPWVVRDDGTVRSMDFHSNQMGDWQGCVVCSVEPGHGGRDHAKGESAANARLIAAAPELLEALKGMVDGRVTEHPHAVHPSGRFCHACGTNSKEYVHHPKCRVLIAELAIAKAEGK